MVVCRLLAVDQIKRALEFLSLSSLSCYRSVNKALSVLLKVMAIAENHIQTLCTVPVRRHI